MTNEEAIELLNQEKIPMILDGKPNEHLAVAHIKAIESLEENDKLKAEVEQFSNELISVRIENELLKKKNELTNYYFEQYAAAIDEIERLKEDYSLLSRQYDDVENSCVRYYNEVKQLKTELEQSVKLPCRVGDVVYECDKDVKEIKCYKIKRMQSVTIELDFIGDIFTRSKLVSCGSEYIGNLIFLTREEAEQSLKDKVEE